MHSELVQLAKKWLMGKGYCIIAVETKCTREEPDVIAWDRTGDKTVVLECKSNYEDFKHDRQKFFRRSPVFGMGDYRYYFVPKGVVNLDGLPAWG